jgi:hypothetical protein
MTRRDRCFVCKETVDDYAPTCHECFESFCINCIDAHALNISPKKLLDMYDLYQNHDDSPESVEAEEFFEEFVCEYCIISEEKDNELINLRVENTKLKKENAELEAENSKLKTEKQ